MNNQQFEKFATVIHDKANPNMKRVLTTDAANETQAVSFLQSGADKMGCALTDGRVYRLPDLPSTIKLDTVEYRSPFNKSPSEPLRKPRNKNGESGLPKRVREGVMADEQKGCVVLFTDNRTGREEFGRLKTSSWTPNQQTPEIEIVSTLDEAILHPFLDETLATARAQRRVEMNQHLTFKILHPFKK